MITDSQRDFILEAREHLLQFEQSLLALETTGDAQSVRSQIDRSLRAIHSFKGDAGFLGFSVLRKLAHAMESLLEVYRETTSVPPLVVLESLLSGRDRLALLCEDPGQSHTADISDMLSRLAQCESSTPSFSPRNIQLDLRTIAPAQHGLLRRFFNELSQLGQLVAPSVVLSDPPEELAERLPSGPVRLNATLFPGVAHERVQQVLGEAAELAAVTVASRVSGGSETAQQEDTQIPAVGQTYTYPIELNLSGLTLGTAPGHAGYDRGLVATLTRMTATGALANPLLIVAPHDLARECPVGPLLLSGEFVSSLTPAQFQATFPQPGPTAEVVNAPAPQIEFRPPPQPDRRPELPALQTPELPLKRSGSEGTAEAERLSSLRVNVELLDRMMTLVGELTLVRNQSVVAFSDEQGSQRAIIQRLHSVTAELQDTVLRTRMQPVGNLFGKFPRMVRDLARQLNKQIELVTIGREVELDKTVLEQLSDPLMHLIRNCVDHGIEPPADRIACGKPPTGTITLTATPIDGQVVIEIRDDGRGIDPVAVRAKAAALHLKTQAELDRMTPRELFSLILLPGFSTARQVTEVSGRGVGMDVVKTNIEQLEGSLTIDSAVGAGTTMLLRVPLTLAIIPCLIVEVAEDRFAVPQRELEEIVCLHPGGKGAVEQTFDGEVFRLRDSLLPIVRLREVLARKQQFTSEMMADILRHNAPSDRPQEAIEYILVLRSRGRRFGLLVDRVRDTQEIVVKPMHPTMKQVGVFSGATLMGDGRVALIASVDGIAEHANCFRYTPPESTVKSLLRNPQEVHRILIFHSGPHEQFALPLVQIRRLELIKEDQIERVGNAEFVMLDGISIRIVRLESVLKVSPCATPPEMYLILPKFIPEPMGILVSQIVDTDSLAIELQQSNLGDAGILGTAIVRGRMSLFLDVQYIREQVFGRRKSEEPNTSSYQPDSQQHSRQPHVLLIDDTPFFREVVRRYLEEDNLQVTTAIDGLDGLSKLAANNFDLVVSDIEMPNLDGWGFAREARQRGCQIPILALTSLSKADHAAKALASGFNDFEEKLDHDSLLRAIRGLLKTSLWSNSVRNTTAGVTP